MHTADIVIDRLARWAGGHENVRTLIVTSTRVIPGAFVDAYSDYDVVAVVDDVRAMFEDTKWQDYFGEVLISYWDPFEANPSTGAEWVSNITNYANGLKIDFSLWSAQHFADVTAGPDAYVEFDAGYRVVVDKDGLTTDLPAPTFHSYIPARPDQATYLRLITDFLIGVPNVAKSLLRGQLLPAKWVLDFDMRFNYLIPLLEWRAECDHDWSLKTGNLGKGLEAHLPADTWRELERTFTGADTKANWDALFEMIALFDRVAREVADLLGYTHPEDLVHRVTEHTQRMREGVFAGGPLDAEWGLGFTLEG